MERRLYREPEERRIAGVCGGLADHLGLDPTIVRLFFVSLVLLAGSGILVYLIAAIVIPERPTSVPRVRAEPMRMPELSSPLLLGLLVLALLALVVSGDGWLTGPLVGLALLAVGIWLLLAERPDDKPRENGNARSADDTTIETEPTAERDIAIADPQGEVPPPVPPWGEGPAATSRLGLPALVLALLLIGLGVTGLLSIGGVGDIDLEIALGLALLVVGLALVVGARWGRARPLIGLGVLMILVGLAVQVIDTPLDAGAGDETVVVDSLDELFTHHDLLTGHLTVDLRQLPPGEGELSAKVGLGQLTVLVPPEMTADVDARARLGQISIVPRDIVEAGWRLHRATTLEGREGGGRVELDVEVGVGDLQVARG